MYHNPALLTKELKLLEVPGVGKRLRVSTNFLRSFGFDTDTRLKMDFQCGRGVITPAADGDWKVHERSYANRKNNPTETVIETSNQTMLNRLVPAAGYDRVHFTFSEGRIELRPVKNELFHIRKHFRQAESIQAFMALSSGLDAWAFREAGFQLGAVLEYRPNEARDTTDLTETGLCTFLRNNHVKIVINEDLATADLHRIVRMVNAKVGPVAVLSIGLQCDDFSNAKSVRLKELEIAQFRPSSRELGYYATKLIELLQPACVFIENVPGWHGSESEGILGAVLSRIGYHVQAQVLNGAHFGAYTARRRCYFVASIFPGFEFPLPTGGNKTPLREVLADEIPLMRDLAGNKTIEAAITTGRERFASLDSCTAPTVLKSQARCTKDSLYFAEEGKVLKPTFKSLRKLHSIPEGLCFQTVSEEIATEQIGQGIEFPLHSAVARAVYQHLALNHHNGAQLQFGL